MDSSILSTVLIGGLVILITQIAKSKGFDQKKVTLVLVAVLALVYWVFKTYVPEETQAGILTAITSIVGTAKILYDAVTSLLPDNKDE